MIIQKLIEALRHEAVHRWFSPKTPKSEILRKIFPEDRLDRMAARGQRYYNDNDYIRYLEEAIAQTYAKRSLVEGLKFPFEYDYTTPRKAGLAAAKYHGLVGAGMFGGYKLGQAGANYVYGDEGRK